MKKLFVLVALLGISVSAWAEPAMKATVTDKSRPGDITATVKVEVTGVTLTDPASVNEVPAEGQAHLHYQVDGGPMIATTAPKLSFHGLTPGKHEFKVMLAANDHSPLGPNETLSFESKAS